MSGGSYYKSTRHPLTKEWDDDALWTTREVSKYPRISITEVKFTSGEVFDTANHYMETRESNIASVDIEGSTPNTEMEVSEGSTERKDVTVTVNALDVEVNDEGTRKAKEFIEKNIIGKLAEMPVTVAVIYRHPLEHGFLTARKVVKVPQVRKYAESCVEAFKQQFVPHAIDEDFIVVEFYKDTDEVKVTTLNDVRAQ